jgi:hypothetical protein
MMSIHAFPPCHQCVDEVECIVLLIKGSLEVHQRSANGRVQLLRWKFKAFAGELLRYMSSPF